jgi:hypothetical protein
VCPITVRKALENATRRDISVLKATIWLSPR